MAEKSNTQIVAPKDVVANVLRLLAALSRQHSLEPLKQLFWSELNYERANQPLSRRNWPDKTTAALFEDPLLFATGGNNDGFHVIYLRLASDQLSLADERSIVTQLLKNHLDSLFIFSNRSLDKWHFLNIKSDEKNKNRLLFRRITVGPQEQLRTASERLAMLNLSDIDPTLSNIPVLKILARHDQAFDVEAVTKKFFQQYHVVFGRVEQLIQGFTEPERKRLFTQRLFNRLMFIAFIQKKGWLKLNGQTNYLATLWNVYKRSGPSATKFYSERLELLFFSGLNTDNDVNIVDINRNGFLKTLIGDVPYLNGGLFEKDIDDSNSQLFVPDECIDAILNDLFARFNFTVTESTPLDIEVAVDPEMLGKVFEELVTGRHETGSYYTPKPVVSFMCREALKGYLQAKLPGESLGAIEQFVDEHDPQGLHNPESALDVLRRVKVCDPACGSGAYLLGMLHELLDLRACLFATRHLDPISIYQRKLEIIQNNIYGVDIDPFAVNIARLRLWLSLEVDFEGLKPQPLPNLDFKIEAGDSLLSPDPQGAGNLNAREYLVQLFREKKAVYIGTHNYGEKQTLRKEIAELRQGIFTWTHGGRNTTTGFDWAVEFAEVFVDGGFDIIVANPPYVRADAQFKHLRANEKARQTAISEWKAKRDSLLKSKVYQTLYEKWDLYLPFLERAYQLLHLNGQMVFIIPDAYNAAKYAHKSHEFFLKNANIERIDFCSDIFLFKAGVNNTILHFVKTKPTATDMPIRVRRWGEKPDDFDANVELLPTAPQDEFGEALFKADGTQAKEAVNGFVELEKICYISKGMVINANEDGYIGTFTTDDVLSETQNKEHPKRFVFGKDIVKWYPRKVRYLEWGTVRAPSQFSRPTFAQLHESKEKLVAVRTPGAIQKVIYDNDRLHFDASSVGFVQWYLLKDVRNKSIKKSAKYRDEINRDDVPPSEFREDLEDLSREFAPKYLLAIMNSTFAKRWLASQRRSKLHIYPDDWKSLPIAPATIAEQASIVVLVDEILTLHARYGYALPSDVAKRLAELEMEIDQRVAALYGL